MRKVNITETVLRDANQSLIATRLPYSKFEPILETMDKAGFYLSLIHISLSRRWPRRFEGRWWSAPAGEIPGSSLGCWRRCPP